MPDFPLQSFSPAYFPHFFSAWTFIAGVIAVVSVISLGLAALLGVCLLLMLKTQERVCLPYRPAVVARLVLSALAGMHRQTS